MFNPVFNIAGQPDRAKELRTACPAATVSTSMTHNQQVFQGSQGFIPFHPVNNPYIKTFSNPFLVSHTYRAKVNFPRTRVCVIPNTRLRWKI